MPMTTAWRNATIDHSTGKTDIGAVGNVWLALFQSNPTESGSQASEVTGTGYARIDITAKMGAAVAGIAVSTDEINFGSPGSDWGTIAYVGVMTASSGGTMRYYEQLPNPRTATSGGRPVEFAAGVVSLRHV